MSGEERASVQALLPGLHYLAAEALRSGCHEVCQVIFNAIVSIEAMVQEAREVHEQGSLSAPPGTRAPERLH